MTEDLVRAPAGSEGGTARWVLPVILVLLFLLRVAGVVALGKPWSPSWEGRISSTDTEGYFVAMDDLSDGVQDAPSFRVPGYPLLLLWTRHIPPFDWLGMILLQQFAELFTSLVCMWIARPVLGRTAGFAAAVLYMALPSGWIFSGKLLPDVWAGSLAAASGLAWLKAVDSTDRPRMAFSAACGLSIALGVLVKPVFLYVPVLYSILTIFTRGLGPVRKLSTIAAICAFGLASPLALREWNSLRFGLSGLTTQDAFEPSARAVGFSGYRGMEGLGPRTELFAFMDSLQNLAATDGRIDYSMRDSIFRSVMMDALRYDPGRIALQYATKWPKFFVNVAGDPCYFGLTPAGTQPMWWVLLTSTVQSLLPAGFAAALLVRGNREGERTRRILALGVAWFAYTFAVIGPIATFRYGMLFYWSLTPGAALFLHRVYGLLRGRSMVP